MLEFFSTYDTEITFIICAMMGGVMHYIKKYLNKETEAKLYQWYGRDNLPATVYTITVFFFAIIGAIAADVVNSATSFWAAMYSGFATGFAIDAGFNSDSKSITKDAIENKNDLNTFFAGNEDQLPQAKLSTNRTLRPRSIIVEQEVDFSQQQLEPGPSQTQASVPKITRYRRK